jgi:ABC-type ATPase with predicted acetyltransferase domain
VLSPITVRYPFCPRARSLAAGEVADLFGLADDEPPHVIAENVTLDVRPGDVVLFTGPSGSGKSSLLRAAGRQLGACDAAALELPDVPLVDALPGPLPERLERLALCGLSEARLLLRTPAELSDGQRYRFRLAYALDRASAPLEDSRRGNTLTQPSALGTEHFILADEFCAVLDRTLAKVLAFNVRKLASRTGVGFLLATTHDDLLDDLNPDLHVRCLGDGHVEAQRHDVKKKRSASRTSYGCRTAPSPTGRTSLGGITAATTSPSSAGSCCSGTVMSRSACASSPARPPA